MTTGGRGQVLHVTDCYDGGVSRAINDMVTNAPFLTHALAHHGQDVPPPGAFAQEYSVEGGRLTRMRAFRRIVRDARPSVVHLHSSWAGGFVRLGRWSGPPVIYQPHCYKFVDPRLPGAASGLYRLMERALVSGTTVTVVLSPAEQRAARSIGATRQALVPNVPSLPPGQLTPQAMARRRVVMMGRLVPQKDHHFFLEVVREGRRLDPGLEAVWIGGGPSSVREELAAHDVTVTGWLGRDEVVELLSQGGVYVHSARYEGLPLAVLEAAQSGLATVLRRIDAFEGMEELTQRESPAELAQEAVRLIQDPAAYGQAVERGRLLLDRHTPHRQSEALRALYDEVLPELNLVSR
jgi:glycosyltransferase involved in cell wall biosynthesis